MRNTIRHRLESLREGRPLQAVAETLLYALGAGVLFYLLDLSLMRWQGLVLH